MSDSTSEDPRQRLVSHFVTATAITAVALLIVALVFVPPGFPPTSSSVLVALALIVAGVVAQAFPLQIADQTQLYVDAAVLTSVALVLEVPAAMTVAAIGVAIHSVIARVSIEQAVFNTAQTAIYVGAGSAVFQMLADYDIPPRINEFGNLLSILACIATMHALNTVQVSTAAALQAGVSPIWMWRSGLWIDLPEHLALVTIGVGGAILAQDHPWVLPVFAAPSALLYVSLRRGLRMHDETRSAIEALADIVDLRDPATAGHSRRVAKRAGQLARELGLAAREAGIVVSAARVHDVGKVGLDRHHFWNDRSGATEGRADAHPSAGARLVEQLPPYALGARLVEHHHERWDGAGFPDQLSDERIPLGARIIAVADAFDSLTTGAGGQRRHSSVEALAELRQGAGVAWDPRVVTAMVKLVEAELAADAVATGHAQRGQSLAPALSGAGAGS